MKGAGHEQTENNGWNYINMNAWIVRIYPDDVSMASEAMAKQLADPTGATVFDMEYRIKHKDGHWVWVRASSYVVWENRKPVMVWQRSLPMWKNRISCKCNGHRVYNRRR